LLVARFVSSSLRNHVIIILKLNYSGIHSKLQTIFLVRNDGRTPRYIQLIDCYHGNQSRIIWGTELEFGREKKGEYTKFDTNTLESDFSKTIMVI
jgi:hypothetical protein